MSDREFLAQVEQALDKELDFWAEHNSMGVWARGYIWPDMIPVEGGKKPKSFVSNQDNNGSARPTQARPGGDGYG